MKVTCLDAADAEFQEAIDDYNEQRAGLGFEFSDEIKETVTRIGNYPDTWTASVEAHTPLPSPSISLQHHLRSTKRRDHHRRDSASSPKT